MAIIGSTIQRIISFLLLTVAVSSIAQNTNVFPDGLGNFWTISDNRVKKIDVNGNALASYLNLHYGKPSSIDASDPFRVLVFFEQSQTLIIINTEATLIGKPIIINDLNLGEIPLVCRSAMGGAWLFQREASEIVRYDAQFSSIEQRISLDRNFSDLKPEYMIESGGLLYISFNSNIILRFDSYGAQLEPLNIQHNGFFRIESNYLFVNYNQFAFGYNLKKPSAAPTHYNCQCNSVPITISGDIACFDGTKFIFCKKIEP
jgi:hypothetical protein